MKKLMVLVLIGSIALAGCGNSKSSKSSKSSSAVSSSNSSKTAVTSVSTVAPTEEVKTESVVSDSSSRPERNGYDEGTNNYDIYGLNVSVPVYFSLSNDSTSDNISWFSETGQSVAMLNIIAIKVDNAITDENIKQYKGTMPAQIVSGMSNDDINMRFISGDITNTKDITVAEYPALSFEVTGSMDNENTPDIKSIYSKNILVFIPGSSNVVSFTIMQSNNTKYSYISDFDKIVSNATQSTSIESSSSSSQVDSSQVTPDLKEFLDSYEAFIDQYVEFVKEYKNNPTDLTLIQQYSDYVSKLGDLEKKANEYQAEENQMSTADYNYYIDVTTRCSQKLLQASAELSNLQQ